MKTVFAAMALFALVSSPVLAAAKTPEPVGQLDVESFYKGSWREIARTPSKLTAGCVASETMFGRTDAGGMISRESCKTGDAVSGASKGVMGTVKILNPGPNTKYQITYEGKGPIKARSEYWVLDHGQNWFIASNPSFSQASIFTRASQPDQRTKDLLANRLKSLGFNIARLEWPEQPPEPDQPKR